MESRRDTHSLRGMVSFYFFLNEDIMKTSIFFGIALLVAAAAAGVPAGVAGVLCGIGGVMMNEIVGRVVGVFAH